MQLQPDRRSIIALSALLIAAILFALITLILAPRFFAGEFRGSYHYWLISARLIPWIGASMLLPALIFVRARRFALTALMLILAIAFVALGNRYAMQLRVIWDTGDNHYYVIVDHLYLPPVDTMLGVYVVECDIRDRNCLAMPAATVPDSGYLDWQRDPVTGELLHTLIFCSRSADNPECESLFQFPPGVSIPIMPDP